MTSYTTKVPVRIIVSGVERILGHRISEDDALKYAGCLSSLCQEESERWLRCPAVEVSLDAVAAPTPQPSARSLPNVIVIGTSRAGKTTLAWTLHEELGYDVVSLDNVVHAMREPFPDIEDIRSDKSARTRRAVRPVIEALLSYQWPRPTVLEGIQADVHHVASFANPSKWLVLGFVSMEDSSDMLRRIRSYETDGDWTTCVGDEKLGEDCEYFSRRAHEIATDCLRAGIPLFDAARDRDAAIGRVVSLVSSWSGK